MWTGRPSLLVTAVLALVLVTGCAASPAPASEASRDEGPSCPPPSPLTAPPSRVVTMDGGAAAILLRLGLADRIVGTAAPDFVTAFAGAERARLDRIPVIDPGTGNAESVIAARPDLVMGISALSFGGFDGTPTVDRLRQAGVPALVACDGARRGPVLDLAPTTAFVERTAAAFGLPERGRALAAAIEARARAAAPAPGTAPVRVLELSSAPAVGQPVLTRGGGGVANGVMTLAGGNNVAGDLPGDLASISAEEVVARDPQAIVVATGFSPLSDADLTAAIRSSPVLAATTAVRENRLVAVPQSTVASPSVLGGEAVATVAAALRAPAR